MNYSTLMYQLTGTAILTLLTFGCADLYEPEGDLSGRTEMGDEEDDFRDDLESTEALLTQTIGPDPQFVALIGQGRNSATEEWKSRCLVDNMPLNSTANNEGRVIFDRTMTQTELDESFQLKASAKMALGLFSASARSSFSRAAKSNSRSINMVYKASSVINTQMLNERTYRFAVPKDSPTFLTQCGDTFVQQIKQGGELYLLVRIDFATESEKRAFEAAVGASYAAYNVDVALQQATNSFKGRATVHVEAYQFGGETERLGGALDSRTAMTCSLENFAGCDQFMERAMAYATGRSASDFPQNLRRSPANVQYTLRDWAMLGAGVDMQGVSAAVSTARNSLRVKLELQADVQNRAAALQAAGYFGAPTDFRNKVVAADTDAVNNVRILEAAVRACYDNLHFSNGEASCLTAASDSALKSAGYMDLTAALAGMDVKLPTLSYSDGTYTRHDYHSAITPGVGHWGDWTAYKICPQNQYVVGYSMRVEAPCGSDCDDTALNAVELSCANWTRQAFSYIRPHDGFWGQWHPYATCNYGPVNGMRIDVEWTDGDDTSANTVKASCVEGSEIQAPGGAPWGQPGTMTYCPPGSAVCGAKVRVEGRQGSGDDTAMNGISLLCCAY